MNTEAKLADNWADKAIIALAAVANPAAWIVANRYSLAKCHELNCTAYLRVKAAIKKRWDEVDRVTA